MSKPSLTAQQRAFVAERAGYCCEYCRSQLRFSPDPFSVEHVLPRSGGGPDTPDNLALACQGCNAHKYTATDAVDPASGERVPLYHPRSDTWNDHFVWSDDTSLIVGLSATGRATVAKLKLNRLGVVNLRRVLANMGEHPPR